MKELIEHLRQRQDSDMDQIDDALETADKRIVEPEAERDNLKKQAQIHAAEAKAANATISEIYQFITGSTGEPGNWNGALPVIEAVQKLTAERDALKKDAEFLGNENTRLQSELTALREENERLKGKQEPVIQIARTELFGLVAELKGGSNWLSGKHNVYSYNRAPKIAADVLSALADVGPYELIAQLKDAHAWKIEGFGHFKDVTMKQNYAPFKAAEVLEQLFNRSPPDLAAKVAELDAEVARWQRSFMELSGSSSRESANAAAFSISANRRISELTKRVAELEDEIARLKRGDFSHERVQNDSLKLDNKVAADQISELNEQVKVARDALQFYANHKDTQPHLAKEAIAKLQGAE